jgi:hypothetical protein
LACVCPRVAWSVRGLLRAPHYIAARFDDVDRAVLADCAKPDATIADQLLALELIARRIEETHRRNAILADAHPAE